MTQVNILQGKYPAKAHAKRVVDYLAAKGGRADGIIYVEGQKTHMLEDSDGEAPFRQRRNFFYLTGCEIPDSSLIYNMQTAHLTLYLPPVNPKAVIWEGLPMSPAEAQERFDVDAVHTIDAVHAHLASDALPKGVAYTIADQVSAKTTFEMFAHNDQTLLREALEENRAVKDAYEVALMEHASAVTAEAHAAVRAALPQAKSEQELRARFVERCVAGGCPREPYSGIFASGTNAATLHYVRNDQPLAGRRLVLVDAACEHQCYAADVTRTLPLNGRFDDASRTIYAAVLAMQHACIAQVRAGVQWESVHETAHRIAITHLLAAGILRGGDVDTILAARTSAGFFPHGLGHYLGMDTHDTGGHANYADTDPLFAYLRIRGALPAGAVVTVEPGIYFCRFILEPMLKDPVHARFIDSEVLERYWDVGGVRIEDNLLVTETGYKNLTNVPKEIDEIEFAPSA